VKKGTPFREAHEIVGKIVAHFIGDGIPLNEVSLSKLKRFSPLFNSDVARVFDVSKALARRRAIGAPSPKNVAAQIKRWRSHLRAQT